MAQRGLQDGRGVVVWLAVCGVLVLSSAGVAQRQSLRRTSGEARAPGEQVAQPAEKPQPKQAASDGSKLEIESFSPRGAAPEGAVISVTFSDDIVTTEALESGQAPESVFSFEPSIEGVLQWESLRQVRFVPARPLLKGTEYIARINPQLQSVDGVKLGKQQDYRFQTPALSLVSARQREFTPDRKAVIALRFSDKVEPVQLRKHLRFSVGENELKWRPQSDVASSDISVVTDPVSTAAVTLTLEPGLAGVSGPLGLRSRVERKVKLEFRMVATEITARWVQGEPELVVRFSAQPGAGNAEDYVTVDPPVKAHFSSGYNSELLIRGSFEPEKRYTVNIKPGLKGYDNKVLVEPVKLSTWMPKITPFLELPEGGGGYLGTQGRMKLRVRTAGVNKINVTARRVFDNNLVFQTLYYNSTGGVSQLGRKIAEKSYEIAGPLTAAQLTEIDLRELLGPGAAGIYSFSVTGELPTKADVLVGESQWTYDSYQRSQLQESVRVNLSNIGVVSKEGAAEVMIFTAALDTAQPLPGVKVSLYSRRNQLLGEGTTNEQGIAVVTGLDGKSEAGKPAVVVAQNAANNEITVLNMQESQIGWVQFDSTGRRFLRDGYEVFLTPERGAYRPGETVHLTGFIRGRDGAVPQSAFPLEVVLKRPDGKSMTPEVKTATESGLLQFDMLIPAYAPTGYYTVDVKLPGSENEDEGEDDGYEYEY